MSGSGMSVPKGTLSGGRDVTEEEWGTSDLVSASEVGVFCHVCRSLLPCVWVPFAVCVGLILGVMVYVCATICCVDMFIGLF